MAYAKCKGCGKENVYWRAKRGMKLADKRCPVCGGELEGKTTGREGANKGKKFAVCVVCTKRRSDCEPIPFAFTHSSSSQKEPFPAGSQLCAHHRSDYSNDQSKLYQWLTRV